MKRRVKSQPTNPFYSSEPAVARSQIAGKPPIPVSASPAPKMVPKKPGRMSGVAGFTSKSKPSAKPAISKGRKK